MMMNVSSAALVEESELTSELIGRRAEALSARLRAAGERAFPPTAQKFLRSFTSGEVAQIIGVSDGYLRQLSLDGLGPLP
jgi:chromosome partitioning protein